MSSVQSAISQIPRAGDRLISVVAGLFYTDLAATLPDTFVVGTTTGLQSKSGSVVIFNTPANVTTALGNAALGANAQSIATTAGDIFRDMGKTFTIYTQAGGSGPSLPYATFTRVRQVKGDTTNNYTEGENGRLGYIVTKSAVDGVASVDVAVARIGSGYGSSF